MRKPKSMPALKLLVLADDDSARHTIQTERADVLVSCGDIFESIILQVAQSIQRLRILAVKGSRGGRKGRFGRVTSDAERQSKRPSGRGWPGTRTSTSRSRARVKPT